MKENLFTGKEKYVSKKSISTLGEYFDHIEYARTQIFQNEHLWYRGLANNNYKLLPSLYRIKDYSFEDEVKIRNEFIDKAKGFVKYSNLTNYEWYFLMQHYGLPTRLLDWTEGYLIALFFALRLSQNDNVHINPCIWIISPSKLNKITVGLDRIIRTEKSQENQDLELSAQYLNFRKDANDIKPIAISSTYSNERILRQKGCFTVHGTEIRSIDSIFRVSKCTDIVQINIARKSADKINRELEYAGISESSIFPDLEGLSKEIKHRYNM